MKVTFKQTILIPFFNSDGLSLVLVEEMIKEVDVDGDGRIDFYEFVHALGEPEQTNDDEDLTETPVSTPSQSPTKIPIITTTVTSPIASPMTSQPISPVFEQSPYFDEESHISDPFDPIEYEDVPEISRQPPPGYSGNSTVLAKQSVVGTFNKPIAGTSKQPVAGSSKETVSWASTGAVPKHSRESPAGPSRDSKAGFSRQPPMISVKKPMTEPSDNSSKQALVGSARETSKKPLTTDPKSSQKSVAKKPNDPKQKSRPVTPEPGAKIKPFPSPAHERLRSPSLKEPLSVTDSEHFEKRRPSLKLSPSDRASFRESYESMTRGGVRKPSADDQSSESPLATSSNEPVYEPKKPSIQEYPWSMDDPSQDASAPVTDLEAFPPPKFADSDEPDEPSSDLGSPMLSYRAVPGLGCGAFYLAIGGLTPLPKSTPQLAESNATETSPAETEPSTSVT